MNARQAQTAAVAGDRLHERDPRRVTEAPEGLSPRVRGTPCRAVQLECIDIHNPVCIDFLVWGTSKRTICRAGPAPGPRK